MLGKKLLENKKSVLYGVTEVNAPFVLEFFLKISLKNAKMV